MNDRPVGMFDTELLDILVCPMTRTPLVYDEAAQELISEAAGVAYPIKQGVPVMLIEEARKL
ncbi:MAG: Trm112 family protein [Parasphingorhabdus sp.]|uniref:Trm112 family protein n=1 Tax=Parasphingorhabdus sp. TaxID=2709688 RepID=UPI00329906AC